MKTLCLWLLLLGSLATPAHGATVITWVPSYLTAECRTSLTASWGGWGMKDGLSHLALQFWFPTANGSILYGDNGGVASDADVAWFRDWGHANGIKVLLCVYNCTNDWDWPLVQGIINDGTRRRNLVTALVDEVARLGLDGVDVDFEGGQHDGDRTNFMLFIQALASALHDRGRQLTVDSFPSIWNAPNTDWWPDLMAVCDGVQSMGYDDTGRSGTGWQSYASLRSSAGATPERLNIGMTSYAGSWMGDTAGAQLDWVLAHQPLGVCLWDASVPGWQDGAVWERLHRIRGSSTAGGTTTSTAPATDSGGGSSCGMGTGCASLLGILILLMGARNGCRR